MLALSLAISLFCGLILLLILPLKLEVIYKYEEGTGLLDVRLNYGGKSLNYLWHPFPYSFFLPSVKLISDRGQKQEPFVLIMSPPPGAHKILTWIFRFWKEILFKTKCCYFSWVTEVGAGDPALTALATGLLWNVAAFFYRNLRTYTRLKLQQPDIRILPCFGEARYRTKLHCIFIFSPGHIIIAGIRTLIGSTTLGKGGEKI
ncbi:MAG: DUF2953 domain-containing protein [Thermanaeromonas sp.]|uniref:DUF2953 domain-containing protein n=1 Tax=Thermanaeromonas sp. TaxID=2003697 RepID=UPI002440030F|nr:DUF2953 domain-containing protein [Thermanaeromonas sp.]MCG0278231.1 DUF2953 domain-containing protein [Thermanaeromonas sp.]